jgi:hypothetical protein
MMNSVLAQSRSFPTWTEVFRNGQAPNYWSRQLFQQTDWVRRMLRSGAWSEELIQLNPLLLDQPLFGSSLEQLTAQGLQNSAVAGEQPSQLPRHFNHPPPASSSNQRMQNLQTARAALPSDAESPGPERRRRKGMNGVSEAAGATAVSRTSEQIAKGSQLPARAEVSLLRRLAGPAADEVSSNEVSKVNQEFSRVAPPIPVSRAGSAAPFLKRSLSARHWRNLVAQRAAKGFMRDWPAETLSLVSGREVETLSRSVGSPLLEEHWITPIDGPAAPAEILIDLARLTEVTDAGAASEMKWPRARSLADDTSTSARSEPLGQGESARLRTGERADGTPQSFSPKHSEFLPPLDGRPAIQEVDHWLEPAARKGNGSPAAHGLEWTEVRDAEESSADSNLAPATLSPSLPPLLPPASAGSPALPMAAATSRYGAWRGEVEAPEKDLSLLAAQMKRILDEEARRHGIDV